MTPVLAKWANLTKKGSGTFFQPGVTGPPPPQKKNLISNFLKNFWGPFFGAPVFLVFYNFENSFDSTHGQKMFLWLGPISC